MQKKVLLPFLFFPLFVNAQLDTALIRLLRVKPMVFIDSSILRSRNYNQGPFALFQGVWRTKDVNTGKIASIAEYSNGKPHGHYLDFSDSGSITQSLYYYHGVLNGPLLEFWENGSLLKTGHYSNGKLEGLFKYFDTTGSLISVLEYANGTREGPEIRFYSSGNVKLTTFYSAGWENGVRREYKDSIGNKLKGEFVIKNGLPVTGKFYENGILIRTQNYDYEQLLREREALNKKGGDYQVKELLSD